MRFIRFFLVLIILFPVFNVSAQKKPQLRQPRILILLDGSSSMLESWYKDQNRFKAAGGLILQLMDSIYKVNPRVEFALRVYGHKHFVNEKDCYDTRREVMFSHDNLTQMSLRLEDLQPRGVSPIAFSLKEAAENDFVDDDHYAYSLILITDGGESCGGNICDIVKTLLSKKIEFKPYIVSMINYEPLKLQYECLGTYLEASTPQEIPVTVGKLVDAFRQMITMPILSKKEFQTAILNTPSVLKVNVPAFKVSDSVADKPEPKAMPVKKPETVSTSAQTPQLKPEPKAVPPTTTAPDTDAISVRRNQITNTPAQTPQLKPEPKTVPPIAKVPDNEAIAVKKPEVVAAAPIKAPEVKTEPKIAPPVVTTPDPVVIPKQEIATLRTRSLPYFSQQYRIRLFSRATAPNVNFFEAKEEPVAAASTPPAPPARPRPANTTVTVIKKSDEKPKDGTFTVQRTDAKETTLEILFTNGKGTFYKTTPKVHLVDPTTGKPMHSFYRTVDASGNPDAQKIPVGQYNLTVEGKSNFIWRNVKVEANKSNKIHVVVNRGSLRFEYEGNPKRAVSEFAARINNRFEPGPVITQNCTQELMYEPADYHMVVNTLPPTTRYVSLEFDAITTIRIEEPGFVQFSNTGNLGRVQLKYPLGDQFVNFHALNVSGDISKQQVRLQPGTYEAHYNMYGADKKERFQVKSNAITKVELR